MQVNYKYKIERQEIKIYLDHGTYVERMNFTSTLHKTNRSILRSPYTPHCKLYITKHQYTQRDISVTHPR